MRRILIHMGYILLFQACVAFAAPGPQSNPKIDKPEVRRALQTAKSGRPGWTSSGGEGLFCGDTVRSLDLIEAQTRNAAFKVHQTVNGAVEAEALLKQIVFQRWAKAFPEFARHFWAAYQRLPLSEWENQELPAVPDRGTSPVEVPSGCVIKNLAVRYSFSLGTDNYPQVFVDYDRSAFERMPVDHQVALIIHETIYTMARELGHLNSAGVRKVTSWLISEQFVRDSFVIREGRAAVHPNALETMSTYLEALGLLDWRLLFRGAQNEADTSALRQSLKTAYLELRTRYKKATEHKSPTGESVRSVGELLDAKLTAYRVGLQLGVTIDQLAPARAEIYSLVEKKSALIYEGMLANFDSSHAFIFMVANDLRIRRSGVNPETFLHSEDIDKSFREVCFVIEERVQSFAQDPVRNAMTEAFDPRKYLGHDGDLHIFKVPGIQLILDRALERCALKGAPHL